MKALLYQCDCGQRTWRVEGEPHPDLYGSSDFCSHDWQEWLSVEVEAKAPIHLEGADFDEEEAARAAAEMKAWFAKKDAQ